MENSSCLRLYCVFLLWTNGQRRRLSGKEGRGIADIGNCIGQNADIL